MSPETESNQATAPAVDFHPLTLSRGSLIELLESLDDQQMTHVPVENGNHALWTMGHLAFADDFFLVKMGGFAPTLPAGWAERFGWGHPCSPNPADFPTVAEVRRLMDELRTKVLDWLASLSTADLDESTGEDWADFAPTRRALVAAMAIHESGHHGQLTVVRKSLNLLHLSM